MMIVGISGSPRKGQNTETMLDDALKQFKELGHSTQKVLLRNYDLKPCIHCDYCKKEHRCIDESANEINDIIAQADAVILASPVYYGSMSSQMKMMIDKTRPLRSAGFKLKEKVGAGIAVGASRNGGQEMTLQAMHIWMLYQGMVVAGDTNHNGAAVVAPYVDDDTGKKSVADTVRTVHTIVKKF